MGALIDLNGLGHYKSKENAMVASVYSATKTYAVGDYVYYNGTLYRCTTAITTAEAWTAGHWTAAKIGDDVTELKTAITAITEKTTIDITNTPTIRAVIASNGSWSTTAGGNLGSCCVFEIPDYVTKIITTANSAIGSWYALLKTYNPSSLSGAADFCSNYPNRITGIASERFTLYRPDDAKYLVFSYTNSTGASNAPVNIDMFTSVVNGNDLIPRGNIAQNYTNYYANEYHYANSAGVSLSSGSNNSYGTMIVPVEPTTHYTCNKMRYLTLLGSDKKTLAASEQNVIDFTTTADTVYVAAVFYNADNTINNVIISSGDSLDSDKGLYEIPWLYDPEKKTITNIKNKVFATRKPFKQYKGNDQTYTFNDYVSIKRGMAVNFSCDFSTFGELEVGLKNSGGTSIFTLIIDSTNYKMARNGSTGSEVAHGLTITDKISVSIVQKIDKFSFEISSNGEKYSGEGTYTNSKQTPTFTVTDMTASNVDFSWTCQDFNNDIWAFGDSYFSYGDNRWMYYLIENVYSNNCLIDAYAGESSVSSIDSLKHYIDCATPKYIVWCLGMNDNADSGDTPNSLWLSYVNEAIGICNDRGITPVFATIPTVPSKNHEGKNNWVRNSGYQYIDFAKAVGATSDGTWFSGMLDSTDNTHPTKSGAMALYYEAITDFPQFLLTK